jgi:hypothetical protein
MAAAMQVGALPPDDGLLQVVSAGGDVAVPERITCVLRADDGGVERGDRGLEHVAVDWVDAEPLELLNFCRRSDAWLAAAQAAAGVDLLRMAVAATGISGQHNRAPRLSRVSQASINGTFASRPERACAIGSWRASCLCQHQTCVAPVRQFEAMLI